MAVVFQATVGVQKEHGHVVIEDFFHRYAMMIFWENKTRR
jgi:hypothetical protein